MVFVFVGCGGGPCAAVAMVRSSSTVVVCLREPLMRRMSSANLKIGEVRVSVVVDMSDSAVVSVPLFCSRFHDVLSEEVELERTERVSLLCTVAYCWSVLLMFVHEEGTREG